MERVRRWVGSAVAAALLLPVAGVAAQVAQAPPAHAAAVVFTVTSLGDAGDAALGNGTCATAASVCTLRAAIDEANAVPANTYTIDFAVSGTIQLGSTLFVNAPVTIDGSSAPGYTAVGGPTVHVVGNGYRANATPATFTGLYLHASNVTVRALGLTDLYEGIETDAVSAHDTIVGCWISTLGATYAQADEVTIGVLAFGPDLTLGGSAAADRNLVSGFFEVGVLLQASATNAVVRGNRFGTTADGTASIKDPNATVLLGTGSGTTVNAAIESDSPSATIDHNLVSGNAGIGMLLFGSGSDASVTGNLVGTDASGAVVPALGNIGSGIQLSGGGHATIGGTAAGAGNTVTNTVAIAQAGYTVGAGVLVDGASATIQGNLVGTNAAGAAGGGNKAGVEVQGTTTENDPVVTSTVTIGGTAAGAGNVIVGSHGPGIALLAARSAGTHNTVTMQGNRIGTTAAGTAALGNLGPGIGVDSRVQATIGGTAAGAGNLISGNGSDGVSVYDARAGVQVLGNEIGTNLAGTAAIPNMGAGIKEYPSALEAGPGGVLQIGSGAAGAMNVISGNHGDGVDVTGDGATVQGNRIGTNAAGTAAVANIGTYGGIYASVATTIGGTGAGQGNLLSGNEVLGLEVFNAPVTAYGNLFGSDAAGTGTIPNGTGNVSLAGATGVFGGLGAGQPNLVVGSTGFGIAQSGGNAYDLTFRGNRVYGNARLNIERRTSITNGVQLPPVLTTTTVGAASTSISGTVTADKAATVLIDVYASDACQTRYGSGEAKEHLGTITVNHAGGGAAQAFSGTVAKPTVGTVITATATTAGEVTSQLSTCAPITDLTVTAQANATVAPVGSDIGFRLTITNHGPAVANDLVLPIPGMVSPLSSVDTYTADVPSAGTFDTGASTWTIPSLAPGATASVCLRAEPIRATVTFGGFTIAATADPTLDVEHIATIHDPYLGDDLAEASSTVGSPLVAGAAVCPLPTLSADPATTTRPATGTKAMAFTVHLSSAQTRDVTVHYALNAGTALPIVDYQDASGTLTIPAGQTTGTVTVQVVGSQADEPAKTFSLTLSAPHHATLATATVVGTIAANHVLAGCPAQPTQVQRFVCHLYWDALGRQAEPGGFGYWVNLLNSGTPRLTMATSYLRTPEARQVLVDRLYVFFLGRHGDASGVGYWAEKVRTGSAPDDIRVFLATSGEFWTKAGGTNAGFVTLLFADVFRRPVDPSGLTYWTGQLAKGVSRAAVVTSFLHTPEGRSHIVGDVYLRFLRRYPTAAESTALVSQLAGGTPEINIYFKTVASTEYFSR